MLWQNMRHGYLQLHHSLQQHHSVEAAAHQVGTLSLSALAAVVCLEPLPCINPSRGVLCCSPWWLLTFERGKQPHSGTNDTLKMWYPPHVASCCCRGTPPHLPAVCSQ